MLNSKAHGPMENAVKYMSSKIQNHFIPQKTKRALEQMITNT
jgi:hypothetical protein